LQVDRIPLSPPYFQSVTDCEIIREGTILYTPLSILQSNGGPRLRRLQWTATDVDVGLDERFVVRSPRTEVGIIFVRTPCRESFW
jgi:hypothetical protein